MQARAYSPTGGDSGGRRPATAKLVKTTTPGIHKKDNRYIVVFRDPSGKQRKRSARTLAEARDLKAKLTADVVRGEYVAESKLTFSDYARQWIDGYAGRTARGVRQRTRDDYRKALGLDAHGEPTGGGAVEHFGRRPLSSIRPPDVRDYGEKLADEGAARNTIRLALAPVKAMLASAYEDGVIRSNPAARLRLGPKALAAPVKATHALSEEELVRVLAEIPAEYREAVSFLADTGLRVSEMLPLTKADVDFGRRLVSVTRRLSGGEVGAPKTRLSARAVVLSPEMARALWSRLVTAPDGALLFPRLDGSPLNRSNLYRVVNEAGVRAGIDWPVGMHALRHSYATILHRRGESKERIRNALGHHSWEFTESVYVHDDSIPEAGVLAGLGAAAEGNARATRPTETGPDAGAAAAAESA